MMMSETNIYIMLLLILNCFVCWYYCCYL